MIAILTQRPFLMCFVAVNLYSTQNKKVTVKITKAQNKQHNLISTVQQNIHTRVKLGVNLLFLDNIVCLGFFFHGCALIIALRVLSRMAHRVPPHCSKVHVCERDSERSLHSLWLHTLLYSLCAVQVVYPPGIQRSNRFLKTLQYRSNR